MRKTWSFLSVALLSVALGAQTTTPPQAPGSAMTPETQSPAARAGVPQVPVASVSAELTKNLDSKRLHVGDQIEAKTTNEAKLADGTMLPKGTKLVGHVVEVKAQSKQEKDSRIVISLNRALLKDGKQVPIQSAVTSMTAAASPAEAAVVSAPSGPPAGSTAGGGGSASATAPSAPSMTPMTSDVAQAADGAQTAQGPMLRNAGDQVPVGNKPTILLSAPNTPDSSAILEAKGKNVSLASGTRLTLNVIPAQA